MIEYLVEAIRVVLEGENWLQAFLDDGYGIDPASEVSAYIKDKCQFAADMAHVPWHRPSANLIKRCCWPHGLTFDEHYAFLPFPKAKAAPKALPAAGALALPAPISKASGITMSQPKLLALPPPPPKTVSSPTAIKSRPIAPASGSTIMSKFIDATSLALVAKSKALVSTSLAAPPAPISAGAMSAGVAEVDDVAVTPPSPIGKAVMVSKPCDASVDGSKASSSTDMVGTSSTLLMATLGKGSSSSASAAPAAKKPKTSP